MQQRGFAAYCRLLREYYGRERRWPDNPFRRRRHENAWPAGPIASGSVVGHGRSPRRSMPALDVPDRPYFGIAASLPSDALAES